MKKDDYIVHLNDELKYVLEKIENNQNGIIFIEDNLQVVGVATDGDIRRKLIEKNELNIQIKDCMNRDFTFLYEAETTKENILKILDSRIKIIPILDNEKKLVSIVNKDNLVWNTDNKIISKAKSPVRISFAGGGTDLTTYFYNKGGAVLNATINKFTHVTLEKRSDNKIEIFSKDSNKKINCNKISDLEFNGELDIIKSILKLLKPNFGFKLVTYSDVQPGSGLGGSSVLVSAIIGAFNNFREAKYDDYEISELAFHAERILLDLSGGWQDQYATVFGGFNFIEFKNDENIVNSLRINEDIKNELEDTLVLCHSGINHDSNEIHKDQRTQMDNEQQKKYAELSKDLSLQMKSKLLKGQLNNFGELLGKSWEIKKKFSSKITSPYLDNIYKLALDNGAVGGKLLGAGGGGYFLFYVPSFKKLDFIDFLGKNGLVAESFTFDDKGLRWWLTS